MNKRKCIFKKKISFESSGKHSESESRKKSLNESHIEIGPKDKNKCLESETGKSEKLVQIKVSKSVRKKGSAKQGYKCKEKYKWNEHDDL